MRQPQILASLRVYRLDDFRADAAAGLTVAMIAIPLSIAIAIASGAPPQTGLVTAIVAGFLISALGGSNVQIGGPTGAFIVVVAGVIHDHGYDGLVLATLMAGAILLVAGYFRLGRLIGYVPAAVVNGFTIGIAAIIATSQLADALGLNAAGVSADFLDRAGFISSRLGEVNAASAAVAAFTIVALALLRRVAPAIPGPLIVIVAMSGLAVAFGLPVETLEARYGALTGFMPAPSMPEMSLAKALEMAPSAFVIAFLAGAESLLSAMVADRMTGGAHRPNAELLAQGGANLASAFFGGLPATGAIARTATNIRAGARTPVAGMIHAMGVLVIVAVAAPVAGLMVLPALAGLLILTAWNMSEPHHWRSYVSGDRAEAALMLLTLVLTVLVDLTVAIGVGVSVGLALRYARTRSASTDWTPPER